MSDLDADPELTETDKAYYAAQYQLYQLYQLGAFGHYTYAPLTDRATGQYLPLQQREAGQRDYGERLRAAQATFEAAAIRKAADWLRVEYPGPDLDLHIRRAADALDRHAAATEEATR
jgi:hypothetical protein